jgi:phenylacetate-coenzyme A ligase PaaK-like adenylate-forming protein
MSLLETVRRSVWTVRQFAASRWSPDRVRAVQERRLRKLLRHAAARSPLYRDKYAGLDLDRCALAELPTTGKGELMADFDRAVTDPAVRRADLERFFDDPANVGRLFLDRFPVCHTSGSQGQPMMVVQDPLALDLLFAFQMTRGNVGYARRGPLEAVRRVFKPARLAVVISRPGFFPSAWVWKHLPAGLQRYVRLLYVQGNDPDLLAKLRDFRPTVLISTPTTLDLLAAKANQLRLDALEQVVPNSEMLTDAARARIAAVFRVPVIDNYACGECLFLGNGCPAGPGTHINADWAVVEVVDEHNRPVPPGTLGHKVLLTNLANFTQPLIRYEVGDRLKLATKPCRCGSRLPRIEKVVGRAADVFGVRSGADHRPLSAYPFQHAFEHFRQVREWQATQESRNRVRVRLELLPGATLDLPSARRKLAERLGLAGFGDELAVELELVPHLSADPRTGKFRRMVSRYGPPDDRTRAPEPVAVAQPA